MDEITAANDSEQLYPLLLIPNKCTTFQTGCDASQQVFINVNITSLDTEGNNDTSVYSGYCMIQLTEKYIICEGQDETTYENNALVVSSKSNQITCPPDNQSQVWIDLAKSPYEYNDYSTPTNSSEHNSEYHQTSPGHVTVEQHNTYITQNVYNNNETTVQYSVAEDMVHKTIDIQNTEMNAKTREERKYIGLQSSDSQSMSGHNSQSGDTNQNDSTLQCSGNIEFETQVTIEKLYSPPIPNQNKYQCEKCKQTFDQKTAFKHHMVTNHTLVKTSQNSEKYRCRECGVTLKNQEKYEVHCMRHGDPDLKCEKCHKVYSSKYNLSVHRKIHTRKYGSQICSRKYRTSDLSRHQDVHLESDAANTSDESDIIILFHEGNGLQSNVTECNDVTVPHYDQVIRDADSVIAKVMSNKIFLLHTKEANKIRSRQNKACNVCLKQFERIRDLKRHLIEHITKSTLSKTPVNHNGILAMECAVCHNETFFKIDRYKAHLREHANLPLYKCTLCDKYFNDCSNFSKHKKSHSSTFFQCDLCQKKFNSKKTLTKHNEYHSHNWPIKCHLCHKGFYFETMLNRHLKYTHKKETQM